MDTPNQSPVPSQSPVFKVEKKFEQLTFPEAIKEVIEGKAISRTEWQNQDHYGMLKFGLLSLHKAGEDQATFYSWIVNDGDLLATDWIVVDLVETGKLIN